MIEDSSGSPTLTNVATRRAAESLIEALALRTRRASAQLVLGLDFALTYPEEVALKLSSVAGSAGPTGTHLAHWLWALLDELIIDEPSNLNNRIAVADVLNEQLSEPLFWGLPSGCGNQSADTTHGNVSRRQLPTTLPRFRRCDQLASLAVKGFISSPFQLFGAGAVGSQSLLGMAMLGRLERRIGPIDLWPYERSGAPIVAVEVWPTLHVSKPISVHLDGGIKDQTQVEQCVIELSSTWTHHDVQCSDLTRIPCDGWIFGLEK
ncbi:MAG: hypothetical protein ACP5PJ_05590 [Acidimicrobiales bacterium]